MSCEARLLSDTDSDRWDAFVSSHPLGDGTVTAAGDAWWRALRWSPLRVGVFRAGALLAGAAVTMRKVPLLGSKVARFEAILPDPEDVAESTFLLAGAAEEIVRSRRGLEIESRCHIPDACSVGGVDYSAGVREALARRGYTPVRMKSGTYLVDIARDDDALVASFGKKCRRDVRKGLREGVEVVDMASPEDWDFFRRTHLEMCSRKDIRALTESQYEAVGRLHEPGHVKVFGARYEGKIRNLAVIETFGIPRYWYGATTADAFEKGLPPTGQVLHFGIMKHLRDRGRTYYDLGQSPGPEPRKGHPNYTVWRFKYEFNGTWVYNVPYHCRSLSWLGKLTTAAIRRAGRMRRPGETGDDTARQGT